ncbi:MAG: protein-L-isoaspartate(D-aspartate) O-methyltransferase [Thermodesulfobacteriota bacterium]
MKPFHCFFLVLLIACPLLAWAEEIRDTPAFREAREKMVSHQLRARGISSAPVLAAMTRVPRHAFVPSHLKSRAYSDHPLPIGEGQTISQPYIVALMTESLDLSGHEHVLEVGTGSGYQAAVLAEIVKKVTSIEIKKLLHQKASHLLKSLGYSTVTTLLGDGYFGHEPAAPFDCIMITAAVDHIPPPLVQQLKPGGRLILPLGNPFSYQNLVLVHKKTNDVFVEQITGVLFVPMTGQALKTR